LLTRACSVHAGLLLTSACDSWRRIVFGHVSVLVSDITENVRVVVMIRLDL